MRNLPFYPLLVAALFGLGGYLGCEQGPVAQPLNPVANTASAKIQQSASMPKRTDETILIGSFNMQRLGPSKLDQTKYPGVMEQLAQIVQQYDVLAIQEITDGSGQAIQQLLRLVNQNGGRYALAISDPVGRKYFEQYAFIFDTTRINGGQSYCYIVNDREDLLHREPYVGRFQTKWQNPFSFSLINIHTDPDEVKTELNVLANLFVSVRDFEYRQVGHDDVIILGDLNAGPGKLLGLEKIQGLESTITIPTMTRKDKTLDNVLLDRAYTQEFTGRAGTLDFQAAFGIGLDQALKISDHMPIWAEFYPNRATPVASTASQPTTIQR
ncbi:MAG: endonuclease/exonuclease/phosphatase family protein [Pirellulales bacterium]